MKNTVLFVGLGLFSAWSIPCSADPDFLLNQMSYFNVYHSNAPGSKVVGMRIDKMSYISPDAKQKVEDIIWFDTNSDGSITSDSGPAQTYFTLGSDGLYHEGMTCVDNVCPQNQQGAFPTATLREDITLKVGSLGCTTVIHQIFDSTDSNGTDHAEYWNLPHLANAGSNQYLSSSLLRNDDTYKAPGSTQSNFESVQITKMVMPDGTAHPVTLDINKASCASKPRG